MDYGKQIRRSGFALVDALMAMAVLVFGIAGFAEVFSSGASASGESTRLLVGMKLSQNVHEYALSLEHIDLKTLHGKHFSPVIDSSGGAQSGFPGWSQTVELYETQQGDLRVNNVLGATPSQKPKRLVVTAYFDNQPVYRERWILAPTVE